MRPILSAKSNMPAVLEKTEAAWEKERARSAATQAAKSRAGRDVGGDCPEIVNPERREQAHASFEFFCRTYFPDTFSLEWSEGHLIAIKKIEEACRAGGLFANAMPRGEGKTSLATAAAIWSMLTGLQEFIVLIGSDADAAESMLKTIKSKLECNDMLMEDWPKVCHPIRKLEGIAHRANGQLFNGVRTHVVWTSSRIVLPWVEGSKASSAIIEVAGITGRIRGMHFARPDGRISRPGLVIPDDPQTNESANSPTQCNDRESIIEGAILGLAGPDREIASIMPLTVIRHGDLADRFLSHKIHPEWQGERTKMLYGDAAHPELWEEYGRIREGDPAAGLGFKAATAFYATNRTSMDEGLRAAWSARKKPGDISAIQCAMNIKLSRPIAFAAEYQNEPIDEDKPEIEILTAEQIANQLSYKPRGMVPVDCTRVTAAIDVQQDLLYWAVCAWEDDFTGYVIDYGSFPDQRRKYFTLRDARITLKSFLQAKSLEESLHVGLERLCEKLIGAQWAKEDGTQVKVCRCPIDANWEKSRDVVYKLCRESTHAGIIIPSHGVGVTATSQPFAEYRAKKGERKGSSWRETLTSDRPLQRRMMFDTNHYKSFVHERLGVSAKSKASLALFGDAALDHKMVADQLTSEKPITVEAKGRKVVQWILPPNKPDNHFLDCVAACSAAAEERGARLKETAAAAPIIRKKVRLSDLQRAAG